MPCEAVVATVALQVSGQPPEVRRRHRRSQRGRRGRRGRQQEPAAPAPAVPVPETHLTVSVEPGVTELERALRELGLSLEPARDRVSLEPAREGRQSAESEFGLPAALRDIQDPEERWLEQFGEPMGVVHGVSLHEILATPDAPAPLAMAGSGGLASSGSASAHADGAALTGAVPLAVAGSGGHVSCGSVAAHADSAASCGALRSPPAIGSIAAGVLRRHTAARDPGG